MQEYVNNDDIFIFGFSRGAYVARFLAEMLDHIGLLSRGNQEMSYFAWKAFSQWQQRQDSNEEEKAKKEKMFDFLQAFRDTFSRPVRRIRFLGLFDTGAALCSIPMPRLIHNAVNSVPRFENAWMQRSKFPYTARSSAKVIRHAVSIDERRAKFRSDLISENKTTSSQHRHHRLHRRHHHEKRLNADLKVTEPQPRETNKASLSVPNGTRPTERDNSQPDRFRRRSSQARSPSNTRLSQVPSMEMLREEQENDLNPGLKPQGMPRGRSFSPASGVANSDGDGSSIRTAASQLSLEAAAQANEEDDEIAPQDIQEVWFPGCHADLGGGWSLADGEESPLSHGPLVWMVREAERAGLDFDREMTIRLKCCEDYDTYEPPAQDSSRDGQQKRPSIRPQIPEIYVANSTNSANLWGSPRSEKTTPGWAAGLEPERGEKSPFHVNLHTAATKGILHDCLEFNNGLPAGSVITWKIMEYLPFRRMDLRPDGSWKAISFPLPMGEVRDIPENAWVHHTALRRMEANENYRPGNLIIGGGGRGVRKAPKEMGMGEWEVLRERGDPVGEILIRKGPSPNKQIEKEEAK